MGCWFVGLGLGYVLHHNERKRIEIRPWIVRIGWTLTIVFGTFVLTSINFFHQESVWYPQLVHSLYTAFSSTIWGFCMAWIILACETGNARPVRILLSWRIFQPLGKLSATLYMIHVAVQYGVVASEKISQYMEIFPISVIIAGEIFTCIVYAPPLSVIYEAPFIQLEKKFIHERIRKGVEKDAINQEMPGKKVYLDQSNGSSVITANGNSDTESTKETALQTP